MKPRIIKTALAVLLLLSLSGCSFIGSSFQSIMNDAGIIFNQDDFKTTQVFVDDIYSTSYTPIELNNCYNSLNSDTLKKLYNEFHKYAYEISTEPQDGCFVSKGITFKDMTVTQADLRIAFHAFLDDNPQLFWLENDGFYYSVAENEAYFQMISPYSGDEIRSMNEKFVSQTNLILQSIPDNLSPVERELFLYDYIVESCVYDENAITKSPEDSDMAYTSYGVIADKSAVCEGYGKAFEYLLSLVGVNSMCFYGMGLEELHLWNAVELDGQWYYTDVTWADSDEDILKYDYFNLTYDMIAVDHAFSKVYSEFTEEEICGADGEPECYNFAIVDATAYKYNYYYLYSTYYECGNDEYFDELCAGLLQAAYSGEQYFNIRVSQEDGVIEYAEECLFKQEPYDFYYACEEVNSSLSESAVDYEKSKYVMKENLGVISILLAYE